jgi:hypothetical protein
MFRIASSQFTFELSQPKTSIGTLTIASRAVSLSW